MHLTCRTPALGDCDDFLRDFFPKARDDAGLRAAVAHEWRVLLENPATLSLIVEDRTRGGGRRVVGCAQLAFVSEAFVRRVTRGDRPWVNVQATRPMADGSWPLLTPAQVRQAHAGVGLFALITRWRRADTLQSGDEKRQVHTFMDAAFQALTRGYRYREVLLEAIGDEARRQAWEAGFAERADYADFYCANPPAPPDDGRPYLMGITREEAAAREGCLMGHFFTALPPRLGLSPGEQELLFRCLQDESDEEIANALGITPSAVKKRWLTVYARVAEKAPSLLPERGPDADERARGPEKRRRLLRYLREHPEELRPAGWR